MADNIPINAPTSVGKTVASKDIGGIQHEQVLNEFVDGGGNPVLVSAADPMPVTDAVSEAALANILIKLLGSIAVTGSFLTDAELRAVAVPVTISGGGGGAVTIADGADVTEGAIADAAIAAGAAGTVSAKLRRATQDIGSIDGKTPVLGQALAAASTPVVLTAAEETILSAILTIADFDTKTGSLTETAPATDTASSGLNGRLQRIAQRLTSLIALFPAALGAGGGLKIDGSGTALPISGTVAVTGAGDASAANQTSQITQETAFNTVMGLIADAAVAAGATGSISAKLRAISRDLVANIVLAAGANAIGKLTANSGVVIGAVEIAAAQTLAAVTAITNNVNTVEVPPTTIFNGKTSTVTAGTRVVLAASQVVKSVTIKALSTNTGFIYVGNATVAAANGFQLSAGDTVSMDISNLNTVNIDSSVNAEGVSYLAVGI